MKRSQRTLPQNHAAVTASLHAIMNVMQMLSGISPIIGECRCGSALFLVRGAHRSYLVAYEHAQLSQKYAAL